MVKKICLILFSALIFVFGFFIVNNRFVTINCVKAEDEIITDLKGYQWVGNDNIDFTGFYDTSSNFVIDGFTAVFGNYLSDDGSVFRYYTINKFNYYFSTRNLGVYTYNTYLNSQSILNIYSLSSNQFLIDPNGYYNYRVITCFLSGQRLTDLNFISFLQANGTLTFVGSERVVETVVDNYDIGYNDGVSYTTNLLSGYGPFLYSTWSIVDRNDYSVVRDNLTGRFTTEYFDKFNGGFINNVDFVNLVFDYEDNNPNDDNAMKIDFDNYLPLTQYNNLVTFNFLYGNELFIILDNGKTIYFDNDNITKSISLDGYANNSIVSIVVTFASSISDYGYFGLGFNSNYLVSYNNGFNDGYEKGHSEGHSYGFSLGKNIGYQQGLADANQYTFFGLISAVVDAPLNAFTSLLNFNILGVNILNLLTGLLTLLFVLVVVKLFLGR